MLHCPDRPLIPTPKATLSTLLIASLLMLSLLANAWGQEPGAGAKTTAMSSQTAPVVIDGETLFYLRGVTAFPAEERAARVRANIIELARDESFQTKDLVLSEDETFTTVSAGDKEVVRIVDVDAELEGLKRSLLGEVFLSRIQVSIEKYRHDRSRGVLLQRLAYTAGATVVFVALLWGTRSLFRWLLRWTQRRVVKSVKGLAEKSNQLIQTGQIWALVGALIRLARLIIYLLLVYFYLNTVLGFFPWSRPLARVLFQLILNPLESLSRGFIDQLPNLAFLVVLWFVVRYVLKFVRAFFNSIKTERIELENFDPEWADPTFKIVRVLIVAFSLVIAYPYIPGSDSLAFKGVSVFVGVLLSLGSSSFISNAIAGLTMTYRGAFKEGERIHIGDVTGTVEDVKLMVTKVRTAKNELVVIPNSNILNTDIINYSQMARRDGIILYSTVGIGYDTPWRQVDALLKMAADRTEALLKDPPPFVLQKLLGDFAVNYELNAWTKDEMRMPATYSELHANIQDVFNEHGVQIMSPAYETDPDTPKIVPPAKWYEAPAKKPT